MRKTRWTLAIVGPLLVALLAVPSGLTAAQQPPETARSDRVPQPAPVVAAGPRPVNTEGLLYLTSLEPGYPSLAVYDPASDTWTALAPYETSCQMAVSASGQLYAYGYSTGTIDLYDPATDTWSPVLAAPPGTTGFMCNLKVTFDGEFLYTEWSGSQVWYTAGGAWNATPLPFTTNAMGDYDPTSHEYVVGEAYTTNAHLIDLQTWTITDFTSPVVNWEIARFGVVMGSRYFFEADGSTIHSFYLGDPGQPPFDHGVVASWYGSAAADRAHALIYIASIDSAQLWAFDGGSGLVPLTGYGGLWHSSVAFVPAAAAGSLHINRIWQSWRIGRPPYNKVITVVRVHDQDHDWLEGASVFGEWTFPDGTVVGQIGLTPTDFLGRVKFRVKEAQSGDYQFCVTDIVEAGYAYDPAANEFGPCRTIAAGW